MTLSVEQQPVVHAVAGAGHSFVVAASSIYYYCCHLTADVVVFAATAVGVWMLADGDDVDGGGGEEEVVVGCIVSWEQYVRRIRPARTSWCCGVADRTTEKYCRWASG